MSEHAGHKKIGDLLLEKGYLTSEQLNAGLSEQAVTGRRLGEILVGLGAITEDQLLDTVSERLNIPKLTLSSMVIDPTVIQQIPVDVARRYTLIPIFKIGTTLTLAMADPLNIIAIDEIQYLTGFSIKRAIASDSDIKAAIDEFYSVADSLNQFIGHEIKDSEEEPTLDNINDNNAVESAVSQLVDVMISRAVKDRASDIHVEPEETKLRIRYRVDGVMREEASPPKSMQNELISRIKVSANLDVSEKRLPQDGRFMVLVDGNRVDLRVSTLPTIHGEKVVIRLLDRRNLLLKFNQLGFNEVIEESWDRIINKPEGLVLISGPTSSGKTSTLYATLQKINSIEKNMITVEDPVEYSLPLIIQVQINEKAGLTFPSTLRSILRQNPDTIMIGEIRDSETARMAIRSALTGHVVFSTIHTNDAPATIMRLIDMGIEPYLVASALKGVLAQRLVRTNCPDCAEPYIPSDTVLQRAGLLGKVDSFNFQHGTGCPKCKRSGYRGLTGIYEFVEINPSLAEMIMNGASLGQLTESARHNGYLPLFDSGLEKIQLGTVCLEELLKETSCGECPIDPPTSPPVRVLDANQV
ncbi:MAG: Flp pilus assembly complex ATPase component TadA [candidate division Zixibacteria bacterium]|nr:Flp pilus assembly complex ATPase component TadA [candidate division Zixibacteria bacterium]